MQQVTPQVFTPNSIDTSSPSATQMQQIPSNGNITQITLTHPQATQYHPRIFSQPATMYQVKV